MTVSIRIVNTGNTEGDEVAIHHMQGGDPNHPSRHPTETLQRGEVSGKMAASGFLKFVGTNGDGRYADEIDVFVEEVRQPVDVDHLIQRLMRYREAGGTEVQLRHDRELMVFHPDGHMVGTSIELVRGPEQDAS